MNDRPPFLDQLGDDLESGREAWMRRRGRRRVLGAGICGFMLLVALLQVGRRDDSATPLVVDRADDSRANPADGAADSDPPSTPARDAPFDARDLTAEVPAGWDWYEGGTRGGDENGTQREVGGFANTELDPNALLQSAGYGAPSVLHTVLGPEGVAVQLWEHWALDGTPAEAASRPAVFAEDWGRWSDDDSGPEGDGFRSWTNSFTENDRTVFIWLHAGPNARAEDIDAAIGALNSLGVHRPRPRDLGSGISATFPSWWTTALVDEQDDDVVARFTATNSGEPVEQQSDEPAALGDRQIFVRLDEVRTANPATPDAPRRPDVFGPAWGTVLRGPNGLLQEGGRLWTGSFWEGGRGFRVTVAAGPEADSHDQRAAWDVLNGLVIEPLDTATQELEVLNGSWDLAPTELGTEELVPRLVPYTAADQNDRIFAVFPRSGGNEVAVEVFDPVTNTATAAAPSGFVWRHFPAIAWTGTELVFLGGSNGPGIETPSIAYDPAADTWRGLADPPGVVDAWDASIGGPSVWTGAEVLLVGDNLAYDPKSDTWRAIAAAPLAPRSTASVVWTGSEALVWGGCDVDVAQCDDVRQGFFRDGAAYDPGTDSWRTVSDSPLAAGVHPLGVWTGAEVVYFAGLTEAGDTRPRSAAYDPTTDEWRALPEPPIAPRRYAAGDWTGEHVIIWGGGGHAGELGDGAAYDPLVDSWLLLPEPPDGSARDRHAVRWVHDRLYVVGGSTTNGPLAFTPTP